MIAITGFGTINTDFEAAKENFGAAKISLRADKTISPNLKLQK